jgi:hypothetical protein
MLCVCALAQRPDAKFSEVRRHMANPNRKSYWHVRCLGMPCACVRIARHATLLIEASWKTLPPVLPIESDSRHDSGLGLEDRA